MKIRWLPITAIDPPHPVAREEQVWDLAQAFLDEGWNGPALLGYIFKGRVQLLSGSHRFAAAVLARYQTLPVTLLSFYEVERNYGDVILWQNMMGKTKHIIQARTWF